MAGIKACRPRRRIGKNIFVAWLIYSLGLLANVWAEGQKLLPADWAWEPVFTVPMLKGEFRVDGVLADNEWLYSTQIGGLIDGNTLMQTNQPGRFLLGYRGTDLYLGFETQRPKGSGPPRILVDKPGWSPTPLWVQNDNMEVWLAPFTEGVKMSGMMEPRYAIAANAAGAYSHDMTGWDRAQIPRELKYAPILRTEHWQGEMVAPWGVLSQMRATEKKNRPAEGVQWKGVFFFHQTTPFLSMVGPQPLRWSLS